MLPLDDPRWGVMHGGYRTAYDPRKALAALEDGDDIGVALDELWNDLHHQGDVGEASYAAVPHLVRIHKLKPLPDWHPFALVAVIEESRRVRPNPQLPEYLKQAYEQALHELADMGLNEIKTNNDPDVVRAVIALVALCKGLTSLGRLALLSEDELQELPDR